MKRPVKFLNWILVFFVLFVLEASNVFADGLVQPRVTTQWVADNINSIKIIDLRHNDLSKGHISGTVHLKWGEDVFAEYADYTLPLNLSETKRVINKMGIEPEDHIVLYDSEAGLRNIIRLYWALKYWNFKNVSIMEGGLALWQEENRPLIYEPSMAIQNEH
jgi:thiosulfate/3-mercaptopyruvate sulfurtransferase